MSFLRFFVKGLMDGANNFGQIIACLVNTCLLSIIYLFGIGFTSILAKFRGKKFLQLKPFKTDSYWQDINLKEESTTKYYKQF
mgnify:CR=1 FL=1